MKTVISVLLLIVSCFTSISSISRVHVFHLIFDHWGAQYDGDMNCGEQISCKWSNGDNFDLLGRQFRSFQEFHHRHAVKTVSLYNIHSLWERERAVRPSWCRLPTNLTMAESEESYTRYKSLFEPSFKNFDGFSTTSPNSSVPRVYSEAFMSKDDFLPSLVPFERLIKGGAYVASDCHRHDSANANRDNVVHRLRELGVRIDGLGRCMHSIGPGGVELQRATGDSRKNLQMKKQVIANYMFTMAFENSIEPGYVTEKVFDALTAGSVPVYLGDSSTLKKLLPHPRAVIHVSDFPSLDALANYLRHLTVNPTAYEEHRSWWGKYDYWKHVNSSPLLRLSWPCRICAWAANYSVDFASNSSNIHIESNRPRCDTSGHEQLNLEGKAVRGRGRAIYFVENGLLRLIPNMDTLMALKFELENVVLLSDHEMGSMKDGPPMPEMKP